MTAENLTADEKPCTHGHALRRKCYICDGEDSQALIASQARHIAELEQRVKDHEEVHADHNRLVRDLDVLLNGGGAAKQASLCDIVAQVAKEKGIIGLSTEELRKELALATDRITELERDLSAVEELNDNLEEQIAKRQSSETRVIDTIEGPREVRVLPLPQPTEKTLTAADIVPFTVAAQVSAELSQPPNDEQSKTITSLCDRLDRINMICHEAKSHGQKVHEIKELSAGFAQLPLNTAEPPKDSRKPKTLVEHLANGPGRHPVTGEPLNIGDNHE